MVKIRYWTLLGYKRRCSISGWL